MKFFDSMPVAANVTDNFPTYTITVNDSSPIWVYCAQAAGTPASHCGQGMVFAANAVESGSNTFEAFVSLAKQLNGTSSSGSNTTSSTSGTSAIHVTRGAGVAVTAVALVFGLFL